MRFDEAQLASFRPSKNLLIDTRYYSKKRFEDFKRYVQIATTMWAKRLEGRFRQITNNYENSSCKFHRTDL
jgi:hypothetical protein